jgi:hypothetical protein
LQHWQQQQEGQEHGECYILQVLSLCELPESEQGQHEGQQQNDREIDAIKK